MTNEHPKPGLIGLIDQMLEDAPGVLTYLRSRRAEIDDEIRRIEKFIKVMGKQSTPKPKAKIKKNVKSERLTPDVQAHTREVALTILRTERDEFTVRDIYTEMHDEAGHSVMTYQTIAQAFRRLRAKEFIGKMGINAERQQLWRILDATAAEPYTTSMEA